MTSLTDLQKRQMFKALATESQFKVGLAFGLDKLYPRRERLITEVGKVYRDVKENPEKYGVDQEMLEMVQKGMETRRTAGNILGNKEEEIEKFDERKLVLGVRAKAWRLIDKKLDSLAKSKKAFAKESLMSLMKAGGIAFDKAQIVTGQATEHISMIAKIDKNISSEEALKELMKIREAQAQEE